MAAIEFIEKDPDLFLREKYKIDLYHAPSTYLAGGAYADVHVFARGKVLKHVKRGDRAYEAYLEWVLDHQTNKHVPKIFAAHKFSSWAMVVIMERLQLIPWQANSLRGEDFAKRRSEFLRIMGDNKVCPKDDHMGELWGCLNYLTIDRRFCFDLGGPNLMMRRDGTFVVTDPVC